MQCQGHIATHHVPGRVRRRRWGRAPRVGVFTAADRVRPKRTSEALGEINLKDKEMIGQSSKRRTATAFVSLATGPGSASSTSGS